MGLILNFLGMGGGGREIICVCIELRVGVEEGRGGKERSESGFKFFG